MSEHDQASQLPTSRGAIDESRRGVDQKSPVSGVTGSPSDVDWSGISSGAEGAMPTGASAAGAGGYGSTTGGSAGLGSEYGGTSLGSSASASGGSSSSGGGQGQSQGQDQGGGGIDQVIGTASQRVGAIGDQVSSKASAVADQATTKADAGMEKAAGGLETLAGTLREKTESMGGGQVQSIATTAADKLESGAEMLRQKDTDQLVSELEALVRQKPAQALLVAAGVGFLFSKALR